jgi:hypothetical protein
MSTEIIFRNYDKPLVANLEQLDQLLRGKSRVVGVEHRLSETFTRLFRDNFLDVPLVSDLNASPNRSNWTHHTYYAIRTTAKAMYLSCTFETMGRLDAVVETLFDYPGVILVAEWESNAFTVFGPGKELEKLWFAVNTHKHADAFLFTYCPINKLSEFITRTVEFWQSMASSRETFPRLFLTVIVTRRRIQDDQFIFMRTLEIDSDIVGLWHDLGLAELDEYKACLESEYSIDLKPDLL